MFFWPFCCWDVLKIAFIYLLISVSNFELSFTKRFTFYPRNISISDWNLSFSFVRLVSSIFKFGVILSIPDSLLTGAEFSSSCSPISGASISSTISIFGSCLIPLSYSISKSILRSPFSSWAAILKSKLRSIASSLNSGEYGGDHIYSSSGAIFRFSSFSSKYWSIATFESFHKNLNWGIILQLDIHLDQFLVLQHSNLILEPVL